MNTYTVSGTVVDNQSGEVVMEQGYVVSGGIDEANRLLGYLNRLHTKEGPFTYDVHQIEGEPDAQMVASRVAMELTIYLITDLVERGVTASGTGQDVIASIKETFKQHFGEEL